MERCPSCGDRLVKQATDSGFVYACVGCGGRMAALPVLRKAGATQEFLRDLWTKARDPKAPRFRLCPHCEGRMRQINTALGDPPVKLDVCKMCASIWFDASEFEFVPLKPLEVLPEELSQRAKEQLALMKIKLMRKRAQESATAPPDQAWQWALGFLGLPVELNAPAPSQRPWATWSIAAVTIIVTLMTIGNLESVIGRWGFIPAQWLRHGGLTLVTSFFLHGGIFHLLSNMYFLLVFGDNVEDHLGRIGFVVLIVVGHLAGMAAHGMLDPNSEIPCVGASAGISGVIAYYAIAFPKVRLAFMFRYWLIFRWFRIPALFAFVLFVLVQGIGAALQVQGFSGVSYLGHLGGLAVGTITGVTLYFLRARTRTIALGGTRR